MSIKISIIIPSFNRAKVIQETLDSVLGQSYPNWDCIIVDDGSTDETIDVLESYVKRDPRFRYFKRYREPKGANTCRNIGIENALGALVVFLDSDDLMAPWCLEDRVKEIESKPGDDVYVFPTASFQLREDGVYFDLIFPEVGDDLLKNFLTLKRLFNISSPTWNTSFLKSLMFDENLPCWQDCELHIRALIKSQKINIKHTIPDIFIRKENQNGNRISNTLSTDYAAILLNYAYLGPLRLLKNKKLEQLYRDAYLNNLVNFIEIAPYIMRKKFVSLALNSEFFTTIQKTRLFLYSLSYTFFEFFKLPNLPYRTRRLFGLKRTQNKLKTISKGEVETIKTKLESYQSNLIVEMGL